MIIEYTPQQPANEQGLRLYADHTEECTVDNTAPHVGTNLLNGRPVEVYWWTAMHGWFEKEPSERSYIFCRCKACVEAGEIR